MYFKVFILCLLLTFSVLTLYLFYTNRNYRLFKVTKLLKLEFDKNFYVGKYEVFKFLPLRSYRDKAILINLLKNNGVKNFVVNVTFYSTLICIYKPKVQDIVMKKLNYIVLLNFEKAKSYVFLSLKNHFMFRYTEQGVFQNIKDLLKSIIPSNLCKHFNKFSEACTFLNQKIQKRNPQPFYLIVEDNDLSLDSYFLWSYCKEQNYYFILITEQLLISEHLNSVLFKNNYVCSINKCNYTFLV